MPVRMAATAPVVDGVDHRRVGAVEPDHGEGEGWSNGCAVERLGDPHQRDVPVADLDDLGEVLGGDRVVLLGRHDAPDRRRPADAHDDPLAGPVMNAPMTGPVVRRNGYSMTPAR